MTSKAHLLSVERYYDFIYHWAQITNRFKAFRSIGTYPIHRGLADPQTGEFSTDVVHRLIAERVTGGKPVAALDAGCGYGGSCIDLHRRLGGTWHGITISRRQAEIAQRNVTALGLANSITITQGSFDEPSRGRYNLIFGIESLIHAQAPDVTIRNLAAALEPGGRFIIVDDMPVAGLPPALAADLQVFKDYWRAPVMPSRPHWMCLLKAAGCEIELVLDLTKHMRPRAEPETVAALADVRAKRRYRDRIGLKLVSDAQEGGLLLERLAREGAIQHVMIVARMAGA